MAITINSLAAPVNVTATLQSGGSLAANTTYYAVVISRGTSGSVQNAPINGDLISEASIEVTFTTTDTEKQALLNWTAVVGAGSYFVFLSTISGNYDDVTGGYGGVGKYCSTANNLPSTTTNSYLISFVGTRNSAYTCSTIGYGAAYNTYDTINIMGVLPKYTGVINISFTGTVTLRDIINALDAAGKQDYYYYNNLNYFILKGSIYIPSSITAISSLTIRSHTLIFFNGGIQNLNPNCNITLGNKAANGSVYEGCIVGSSYDILTNIKAYNCTFVPSLLPNYPGISAPQYRKITGVNLNVLGCMFKDYGAVGGDMSNNYLFNAIQVFYMYFEAGITWTNMYLEAPSISYPGGTIPAFRNSTINTYSSYFMNGNVATNAIVLFYDCVFGGTNNNYKTNLILWGTRYADGMKFDYYYSINGNIIDSFKNNLSNVDIIIYDKDMNLISTTSTDSNGVINKVDIKVHRAYHAEGTPVGYLEAYTTRIDINPITIIFSKDSYETYTTKFDLVKKFDEIITLKPIKPIRKDIEGNVYKALLPEKGSDSKLFKL